MQRHACFTCMTLTLYMLSSLVANGQEHPLELINPDGSAAADSVAVAVIAPGVYLDEQLALPGVDANGNVSIQPVSRQIVPLNTSKNGLLPVPAEAKAVVSQNQHGFAFVPPGALAAKVKLRPWAKLEIDASNVPEQLRSKYQLRILWENNFAGSLSSSVEQKPRRTDNPFGDPVVNDPFATPAAAPPDWRFHNYVTRSQTVEIVDQTVAVPPGEVTLVLDVRKSESNESTGMPLVTLGIVRSVSNQTAEFALPTFGSAQGQFVGDVSFPNWSRASDQAPRIIALPVRATNVPPPRDLSQLLSDMAGSQDSRSDPFAAPSVAQQKNIADAHARYFASAEGTAVRTSRIGIAIAATDEQGKFTFDALPTGVYELRLMPPDGTKGTLSGYEAAQGLAAVGSDSPDALRFDVKANELSDLGSVAWTEKQVAGGAVISDDGAAEIVESWLKSASQNADRSELKQLLETHLSTEFDMNQKMRRAEIDRLQQLLEQSRTWLDQRQKKREAIIQRRVQELLK